MTTLYDALLAYGKSDVYPFHMPGHKRQVEDFENPFLIDITEIDGFDNLHHPAGNFKGGPGAGRGSFMSEKYLFFW